MKKIIFALLLGTTIGFSSVVVAQNENPGNVPGTTDTIASLEKSTTPFYKRFSIMGGVGSNSINYNDFSNSSGEDFLEPTLSSIALSYKFTRKFSMGISYMDNIGNSKAGYLNKDGVYEFLSDQNDQLGDEMESDEDDNGNDEGEEGDDDEGEEDDAGNDDNGEDGNNNQFENESMAVMLTANYKFSNKVPFFIHAAGGYSFAHMKPAYSVMLGYNQVIFKGLGIYAGVRYSDSSFDTPTGATDISPSDGFKVELGVSYNF